MVNTSDDIHSSEPNVPEYVIIEQALIAKNGNEETCEDALYIGPHFVAVIDGATSKTERRWNGKTGGRIAAEVMKAAFDYIPSNATARQAVDIFTASIQALYKQHDATEVVQSKPVERAIVCFVAISFERKEIWFVGDCQCLLNQKLVQYIKEIDTITENARSMFLEAEIAQGKSIEELCQHDTGREFILPLLERQMVFQNNHLSGQYWFPVVDGFDVPDEGIHVLLLADDIDMVVLSSDGYPYLKDSLDASEQALQDVLRDDPLLFRTYKTTKGLQDGNVSFDDRAYVKIALKKRNAEE